MRAQRAKVALTFVCDQLAETVDVHALASIHEGERESVNKTASEAAAIAIAIVTATAKEEALADVNAMAKLVEAVAAMVPVASSERPEVQRAPSK